MVNLAGRRETVLHYGKQPPMKLWVTITIIVAGSLILPALLTVGVRKGFPGRNHLLSNSGEISPALRAITATYGLVLAFVLAASLQSFVAAQGRTVDEADSVVAIGNLARTLPAANDRPVQKDPTACLAGGERRVPSHRGGRIFSWTTIRPYWSSTARCLRCNPVPTTRSRRPRL